MGPYDEQQERRPLSYVERMGLLGSILSTVGEALGTMADVLAIEESRLDEIEQQRQIDDLQQQINELKAERED